MTTTIAVAGHDWRSKAERMARGIRLRGFDYVMRNDGGYLSQICSAAETFAWLYTRALTIGPSTEPMIPAPFQGNPGRHNPGYRDGGGYNGPKGPAFDRFIFSPAHYALVLYVALIESGRLAPEALEQFNVDGSKVELIGAEHSPGVATTTGSLAQALSQAMGVALARRLRGDTGDTWVMMSDGEFQEGQTWEALQALAFHRVGTVCAIVDVNGQQCDGPMDAVMTVEPLRERVAAFGCTAIEVDGHDMVAMDEALARREPDRPLVILARTDPARGVPLLRERAPMLHYLRFSSSAEREGYRAALTAMIEG